MVVAVKTCSDECRGYSFCNKNLMVAREIICRMYLWRKHKRHVGNILQKSCKFNMRRYCISRNIVSGLSVPYHIKVYHKRDFIRWGKSSVHKIPRTQHSPLLCSESNEKNRTAKFECLRFYHFSKFKHNSHP